MDIKTGTLYNTLTLKLILTFNETTKTGSKETSHMSESCFVYYLVLPLILPRCCRRRNCEPINGSGHLITTNFSVAVVADSL